jgi:hypothetical protein
LLPDFEGEEEEEDDRVRRDGEKGSSIRKRSRRGMKAGCKSSLSPKLVARAKKLLRDPDEKYVGLQEFLKSIETLDSD